MSEITQHTRIKSNCNRRNEIKLRVFRDLITKVKTSRLKKINDYRLNSIDFNMELFDEEKYSEAKIDEFIHQNEYDDDHIIERLGIDLYQEVMFKIEEQIRMEKIADEDPCDFLTESQNDFFFDDKINCLLCPDCRLSNLTDCEISKVINCESCGWTMSRFSAISGLVLSMSQLQEIFAEIFERHHCFCFYKYQKQSVNNISHNDFDTQSCSVQYRKSDVCGYINVNSSYCGFIDQISW